MAFPSEFPSPAVAQLLSVMEDQDPGRIALAVYDLTGYGLGQVFPDARYPVGLTPEQMIQIAQVLAYLKSVDWEKWRKLGPEIVKYATDLRKQGYGWPRIVTKVMWFYGSKL